MFSLFYRAVFSIDHHLVSKPRVDMLEKQQFLLLINQDDKIVPCQLIPHPRRTEIPHLLDGEGPAR